jgi:hypothetical protein
MHGPPLVAPQQVVVPAAVDTFNLVVDLVAVGS